MASCSILGWVAYNFLPGWELPDRLREVTVFSSKELQDELGVAKTYQRFQNSVSQFAVLGGCFGLASLFLLPNRPAKAIGCVAGGFASGACAGIMAYNFFGYVERGGSIPGVDDGLVPLVLDIILLTIASLSLAVPVSMAFWYACPNTHAWDPKLMFVAGIVAGSAIPIAMSIAFPYIRSDAFPPKGWELTLAWLCSVGILFGVSPYLFNRKIKSA